MNQPIIRRCFLCLLGYLMIPINVVASELIIPNQFTSGSRALAAEVNANFDAASVSVNDNQSQINELLTLVSALASDMENVETTVAALQAENEALRVDNQDLRASIEVLESDSVTGLSGILSVTTDNQDNPVAIFSGVNVQVNNGLEQTDSVNGLGNLVIGYDENSTNTTEMCSLGRLTDQGDCEANSGLWSNIHKSGSHNLIVGKAHNYSQHAGLVTGLQNNILASQSIVIGGVGNTASGTLSLVTGGESNIASGVISSVSGGFNNTASGSKSSVSGGSGNTASGIDSSVSGGLGNTASGNYSSVSGGLNRQVSGQSDWAAGSLFENF